MTAQNFSINGLSLYEATELSRVLYDIRSGSPQPPAPAPIPDDDLIPDEPPLGPPTPVGVSLEDDHLVSAMLDHALDFPKLMVGLEDRNNGDFVAKLAVKAGSGGFEPYAEQQDKESPIRAWNMIVGREHQVSQPAGPIDKWKEVAPLIDAIDARCKATNSLFGIRRSLGDKKWVLVVRDRDTDDLIEYRANVLVDAYESWLEESE